MSTQIIRDAVDHSYALADLFLSQDVDNKEGALELESRIGHINQQGQFISGVDRAFFMQWLDKMEAHNQWISVSDWTDTIDFLWSNDVRGTKANNNSEATMTLQKKKLIQNITFECNNNPYDVRLSLKTETPQAEMPDFPYRRVRVKRRKEFNHKNIVLYCFTVTSEGKDKVTAIQNGTYRYEIEFELLNTANCRSRSPKDLIASLLEKTVDFLGRDKPYRLQLTS